MAEEINNNKVFSLFEVCMSIQKTLAGRYKSSFWVKAEMNKLHHYPHSGHCYPELVEKKGGKIIAQMRANLWRDDYTRINNNYLRILKEPLKDGITILFCASITFDPAYGIALRITDIDPAYTLGQLEKEKGEAIERLKARNLFKRNKEHSLALLPKRIAVISVQTSRGYADFMKVMEDNVWGYRFFYHLFPALLQGDRAADSIMVQLQRIQKVLHHFDVVAIIRGGGGDIGLSCYNDFRLSEAIALFPLPVITGIGHSTNETVAEMLAFENAITPTKLAEFLIQRFHDFSVPVQRAQESLIDKAGKMITDEKTKLHHTVRYFRSVTGNMLAGNHYHIQHLVKALQQQLHHTFNKRNEQYASITTSLKKATTSYCNSESKELNNFERSVHQMNPVNVLKRGYSITLLNGKAVNSYKQVHINDILETVMIDGSISSRVEASKESDTHE